MRSCADSSPEPLLESQNTERGGCDLCAERLIRRTWLRISSSVASSSDEFPVDGVIPGDVNRVNDVKREGGENGLRDLFAFE